MESISFHDDLLKLCIYLNSFINFTKLFRCKPALYFNLGAVVFVLCYFKETVAPSNDTFIHYACSTNHMPQMVTEQESV
jgi:hypothetical protein